MKYHISSYSFIHSAPTSVRTYIQIFQYYIYMYIYSVIICLSIRPAVLTETAMQNQTYMSRNMANQQMTHPPNEASDLSASAQFDQNLPCALYGNNLGPKHSYGGQAKLIRLSLCPGRFFLFGFYGPPRLFHSF